MPFHDTVTGARVSASTSGEAATDCARDADGAAALPSWLDRLPLQMGARGVIGSGSAGEGAQSCL